MYENIPITQRIPEIGEIAEIMEIMEIGIEVLFDDEDEDEDEDENDAELNIILDEYLERSSFITDDHVYEESSENQYCPQLQLPVDFLLIFKGHIKLIHSCALHPHQVLCATGSDDDHIFASDDSKILPDSDALSKADHAFTADKNFVATCNSEPIKLWDVSAFVAVIVNNPIVYTNNCQYCARGNALTYFVLTGKIVFSIQVSPVDVNDTVDVVEHVHFSISSDVPLGASDALYRRIFVWEVDDDILEMQRIHKYTLIGATMYGNTYGYDTRTNPPVFKSSGKTDAIYSFCFDHRYSIL
uniref:Uncharacterized protein n=1 Tax=Glossina morsitans morsitans TaxID=37546 RepID=A0A1B0FER7_GLOMM